MGRAASSTSRPALTRAYDRSPLILIADTDDGTWRISPRSFAIAASTSASCRSAAPVADTTSPSASSVTVAMPSRIVASYALSARDRYPSSRVAFSTPMIRTPVAIGSSVPACPTLRVPARRRTRPTTWCDVQPMGLSITTKPDSGWSANRLLIPIGVLVRIFARGVGGSCCLFGHALIGGPGLRQKLVDLPGVLRHSVRHEGQGRGELKPQLLADLGSDQAGRRGQRRRRSRLFLIRAQHGVEGRRLTAVPREPYVGDGDEAQPRILDPAFQHVGDDHLDLIGQLEYPWRCHASLLRPRWARTSHPVTRRQIRAVTAR